MSEAQAVSSAYPLGGDPEFVRTYRGHSIYSCRRSDGAWISSADGLAHPVIYGGAHHIALREVETAIDQVHAAGDVLLAVRVCTRRMVRDEGLPREVVPYSDIVRRMLKVSQETVKDGIRRCTRAGWIVGGPESGYSLTGNGERLASLLLARAATSNNGFTIVEEVA